MFFGIAEMGTSRIEYMRDNLLKKREKKIKTGKVEPKKGRPKNLTQLSRD